MTTEAHDAAAGPSRKAVASTPLAVIGLFLSFVEAGLAYTVGVLSGWLQTAVVVFMCLFAVGVASSFFVILWKRNWVLYPPSEFHGTSVQGYVGAMRGNEASISTIAMRGVDLALKDTEPNGLASTGEIREKVMTSIRTLVVSLDSRPLRGELGRRWEEPYEVDLPVSQFLDRICTRLQPFPPYSYGTAWVLKDVSSGRTLDHLGSALDGSQSQGAIDERSVGECGIRGGMALEVVPTNR